MTRLRDLDSLIKRSPFLTSKIKEAIRQISSETDPYLKSSDLDSKTLNLNPKSLLVASFKKHPESKSSKK